MYDKESMSAKALTEVNQCERDCDGVVISMWNTTQTMRIYQGDKWPITSH